MTPSQRKIHRTAAACCLLVWLTSCATLPPPTTQLAAADAAITAATPDGARYAADELAAARHELEAGQAAMTHQDYQQAQQMADAALADADLARAKGRALAAQSAVVARTEDNATLRRRLIDQEQLK